MDGRCKTCKWWDDSRNTEYDSNVRDQDPDGYEAWGECRLMSGYHKHARVVSFAWGDAPTVVTAPDFGCVQWEAKGDD